MLERRNVADGLPLSLDRLPTLTEVVELALPLPAASPLLTEAASDVHPPTADAPEAVDAVPPATDGPTAWATLEDAAAFEIDFPPDTAEGQGLSPRPEAAPVEALLPGLPAPDPGLLRSAGSVDSSAAPGGAPLVHDPAPDADALVARVLALVEPRLADVFDDRLQAALAPALARAADGLIRDARLEMADTLRAMVQEAVAQALKSRADPGP